MPTRQFGANGMSCDHYEIADLDEVTTLAGAEGVLASAPTGRAAVTDTQPANAQDADAGPGYVAVFEA